MDGLKIALIAFIAPVCASIMVLTSGCNTSGCMENRSSVPLAGFYNASDGAAISLDSIEISGENAPGDSVLSPAGATVSKIYLPMRSTEDVTTWIFAYRWKALDYPALNDTITFQYSTTPYFASEECGVIYKYRITALSHTSHLIDSVGISDSLITNTDIERIKIYFRTAGEDEEES